MNAIDFINNKYNAEKKIPDIKSGDSVKVYVKIKEGDKERVQVYEGVVISMHRNGVNSSFTVRKVSYGVGVERVFPYSSPSIERVEILNSGKVRRAKLYYLRDLSGKKARIAAVDQLNLLKAEPEAAVAEEVAVEAAKA